MALYMQSIYGHGLIESLQIVKETASHALLQQSFVSLDSYLSNAAADTEKVSLKLCKRVCRCLDKLYQLGEALWV